MDRNKLSDVLKKALLFIECSPLKIVESSLGRLDSDEICAEIDAALAEPVKNCEVGTAAEQSERFDKFCHANINTERCCGDCPAFRTTRDDCELIWAQMPYESEAGK